MPQPFQIAIQDLAGGLNQAPNKSALAPNQLSECVNFYPWGKTLRKRPGRGPVNSVPSGARVTGLFAWKQSTGDWTLLVGQPDSVDAMAAGALVPLPVADGRTYVHDASNLWRFRQYLDAVYAVRKQTGRVKVIRPGYIADAGIPAPVSGPALTQGANGGNLDAGAYIGVYTYFNATTGAESNPSPPSNTLGIAAGKMIQWDGIIPPTTVGVNAVRLYRTTVDAQGQYYFVGQLAYPGTLTLPTDAVATQDLGPSVSLRNGLPPIRAHLIEVFAERLWLSDGVEVFFGEPGQPESFFGTSVIDVAPDDGHEIRALHTWNERLVVGKTNAVYFIEGTSDSTFQLVKLTDKAGVLAGDTMRSVEHMLFWYDGANIYAANGQQAWSLTDKSASDERVRKILDSVATSQRENAVGAIYPRLNQYRLSIAANGATEHNTELIYNYQDDTWTFFQYPAGTGGATAPTCYGDFYATDYEQLLYAGIGNDGTVWDLNSGLSDNGVAIAGHLKSRYFQIAGEGQQSGLQLTLRRIFLHSMATSSPATLELFLDSDTNPFQTRIVSLSDGKEWRPRALSNMRRKATMFAWSLDHSGIDGFEVYGAVLHGMTHERTGRVR